MPAPGPMSSSSVIVNARTADHDPGSSAHHLLSARAQSRRSSSAGFGGEAGDEVCGVVSVAPALANGAKPPLRVPTPIRCSMPSCSVCHQVPLTRVIPVPAGATQRHRAKRVPVTVEAPAREALQVGAVEGVAARRRHAARVRAELGPAGGVPPVGVGADVPAALRDRVLGAVASPHHQ